MSDWPTDKFNVIYADPGWRYGNFKTGAGMKSGASQLYTTMTLPEIIALQVPQICEPRACLFLWTTTPMKHDGMRLMEAWGFSYRTTIYWHKGGKNGNPGRLGMGFWFRGQVEELLFGIRGDIKPFKLPIRNHLSHPVLKHSEKPEVFRQLIDSSMDKVGGFDKRIELFARKRIEGWSAWGNQLDGEVRGIS